MFEHKLWEQVANIADLYFKTSLKARLSIVYVETWEDQDQVDKNDNKNDQNDDENDENDNIVRCENEIREW